MSGSSTKADLSGTKTEIYSFWETDCLWTLLLNYKGVCVCACVCLRMCLGVCLGVCLYVCVGVCLRLSVCLCVDLTVCALTGQTLTSTGGTGGAGAVGVWSLSLSIRLFVVKPAPFVWCSWWDLIEGNPLWNVAPFSPLLPAKTKTETQINYQSVGTQQPSQISTGGVYSNRSGAVKPCPLRYEAVLPSEKKIEWWEYVWALAFECYTQCNGVSVI